MLAAWRICQKLMFCKMKCLKWLQEGSELGEKNLDRVSGDSRGEDLENLLEKFLCKFGVELL